MQNGKQNHRDWDVVIGLEVHVQLNTASKIFSAAATLFGQEPNTQADPVDLALPGTLPVLNKAAVNKAIAFGLAIGGQVARRSVFARKNYFYPDLPKGYQISQFELPIVVGGKLGIVVERAGGPVEKVIRITRAHLEEDAGKSLHEDFSGATGVDYNRAGTPLLEVVSEPEIASAQEAVAYAKALYNLVTWIDICDGNMQEGSFRMDANVSVKPSGAVELGTRCEIKNLNSFRFLEEAIGFEVRRQIELIEDGGQVRQETRLYDADRKETRTMRTKEDAHDYRYFPDPDLPPLCIDEGWIDSIARSMPELPGDLQRRMQADWGLSQYDAQILTSSAPVAQFFLAAVSLQGSALCKPIANWIMGDLLALHNREGAGAFSPKIEPATLVFIVTEVQSGRISAKAGKQLLAKAWANGGNQSDVARWITEDGLAQVNDVGLLNSVVDDVVAQQHKLVAEYLSGKEKAFNALVGQVMKASQGKANPQQVGELLRQKLSK